MGRVVPKTLRPSGAETINTKNILLNLKPYTLNLTPYAFITFLVNFTFGVLVKSGVIESGRFRVVHHALYFLTIGSIAIAAILSIGSAPLRAALLGGMTALLLAMPFFKGRSRGHWMYATFCAVLYSAIVIFS